MATGALHQLVGVSAGLGWVDMPGAQGRSPLIEIAKAGVVASVEPDLLRSAFVWFMLFGFLLLMLGALVQQWERSHRPVPASVGWQLLALGLLGVVLLPVSGFWLCFPQGVYIVRRAGRPLVSVT